MRRWWIAATAVLAAAGEVFWVLRAHAVSPLRGAVLAVAALALFGSARSHGRAALAIAAAAAFWSAVLDTLLARVNVGALDFGLLLAMVALHAAWLSGHRVALRRCLQISVFGAFLVGGQHLVENALPVREYTPVPDDPSQGSYVVVGPDGWIAGRPGFHGHYEHPEFAGVPVVLNSLGYRDDECDTKPPTHGELSVLALGDSMFFGTGVRLEETMQAEVERRGAAVVPRGVRVVSAAVPGHGPVQYRATLQRMLGRLHPEVVVVGLFEENDFQDAWSAAQRETEHGAATTERAPALDRAALPNASSRLERFVARLLQPGFWTGWDQGLVVNRRWLRGEMVEVGLRVRTHGNPFLDSALQQPASEQTLRMRDLVYAELERLRDDCRAANAELLVMVIPASVQTDPAQFAEFASLQPVAVRGLLSRTAFHAEFVAGLRERALRVIDTMAFAERELAAGRPVYLAEGHWNAHGHACAAAAVVEALAR